MIETYRGAVAAWECDAFGHMNIAHYPDRFAAAAANLVGEGWRTAALDTQYLSELRAAAVIVIRSGVVAADNDTALVAHEAVSLSGERTTLAEHRLVRAGGAPTAAGTFAWERFPAPDWPAGDGVIPSGRDRARGVASLSFYVHRFSDACLFAIEALGMTEAYRSAHNRGFATFETRLLLEPPAPAEGEGLVVTSGIAAIGGSSLRIVHRMRALDGGRLLARFYQAGVHFDLAARRAAPWPDGFRDRAAALGFAAH